MPNFISIMRYMSDICLYLTAELIVKEISLAAEEFYQLKNEMIADKSYSEICKQYKLESLLPDSINLVSLESHYKYTKEIYHLDNLIQLSCALIKVKDVSNDSDSIIIIANLHQQFNKISDVRSYYENLIAHMPGNVYWLDRNCITLGCNNNVLKLIGLKNREEFIGITYEEMGKLAGWTGGQAESFKKDDMRAMSTGVPVYNIEEPLLYDNNGYPVYYLSSRVPLKDKHNNIIGVVGISIDITEKKITEEKLRKAIKSKSEFLSLMSHEIRGPLSNVVGAVDLIKHSLNENITVNDIIENLDIITEETHRTLNLLDNVIKLLELDNGKFESAIEPTNVKDLIEKLTFNIIDKQNTQIVVNIDKKIPSKIMLESMYLIEVLNIIIGNSIRFTNDGLINIDASLVKINNSNNNYKQLKIIIRDNGCGINNDQILNLFKAFIDPNKECDESLYRKPSVRLSLAKKLIELMGGEMDLQSQLGVGTTVTIQIPFSNYEYTHPEYTAGKNKKHQEIKDYCLNILLVEDDSVSASLERKSLITLGHNVITVSTGAEAIQKTKENNFDLIFMDITLPDINGIEVTRRILKEKTIDIVAVTSHANERDINKFMENGMIAVITKPVSLNAFKEFLVNYKKVIENREDEDDF